MGAKKETTGDEVNLGGAPTKYKNEYDEQAYKLCLLGATDEELADFFNVTETTVNNWKISFPTFFESIKKGKRIADAEVADRLYQRAKGFEHPSEEIKVISMAGAGSVIERVPIIKVYPPDTTAAIFWLKNRQPRQWRDKQDIDHTTNGNDLPSVPHVEIIYTKKEDLPE